MSYASCVECLPKWRNGRRGGLKNRWGLNPVPVRIRPSAPLDWMEETTALMCEAYWDRGRLFAGACSEWAIPV